MGRNGVSNPLVTEASSDDVEITLEKLVSRHRPLPNQILEDHLEVTGRYLNISQKGKQISFRHPPNILWCLEGYTPVTLQSPSSHLQSPDLEKSVDDSQIY